MGGTAVNHPHPLPSGMSFSPGGSQIRTWKCFIVRHGPYVAQAGPKLILEQRLTLSSEPG